MATIKTIDPCDHVTITVEVKMRPINRVRFWLAMAWINVFGWLCPFNLEVLHNMDE